MDYLIEKIWATSSGLRAVIIKHTPTFPDSPLNFRCGYVEVPNTNPNHGKHYYDHDVDVDVHGGLTYSSNVKSSDYPIKFNPIESWWFGYDCGHYEDSPEIQDLDYCIHQCESLAAQLSSTDSNEAQS